MSNEDPSTPNASSDKHNAITQQNNDDAKQAAPLSIKPDVMQALIEKYEAHQEEHGRRDTRNFALALVTLVLVATYTAITYCLYAGAEDGGQRELRAYVHLLNHGDVEFVEGVRDASGTFTKSNTGEFFMTTTITIINTGLTPAKGVAIVSKLLLLPSHIEVAFGDVLEDCPSAEPGPPDETILGHDQGFPAPLTSVQSVPDPALVLNGEWQATIHSCITYLDIFGERQITDICLFFDAAMRGFRSCPNHNDMT